MKLIIQSPRKALKAFLKQRPSESERDKFKENLISLLDKISVIEKQPKDESEEHLKNNLRDFLRDTYYLNSNAINTKDKKDLVIHVGKTTDTDTAVIIEAKRPSNSKEMITADHVNRRLEGTKPTIENVMNLLARTISPTSVLLEPTIQRDLLLNKTLTFNSDSNAELLEKIKAKHNFELREKADKSLGLQAEVGSGIDVLQDFVSKANALKLKGKAKVGDGVFVLSDSEFTEKKFSKSEKEIIKPYYTTEQLQKYYGDPHSEHWILYTKSDIGKLDKTSKKMPIDDYPKIKAHLDTFKSIITSDNKPYGLHRTREQHLFEGEKIFALRKCPTEPKFTYTDFDCFVSRAFLVIQSDRINLKYLTGLLNSKLIAFWLRKKGKMQGNAYQLDKEPMLEIPIYKPGEKEVNEVAKLVDKIIALKTEGKDSNAQERKIDEIIYKLYDIEPAEQEVIERV